MARSVTELRYPSEQLRFGVGGTWKFPARALGEPNEDGSYTNTEGDTLNLGLYSAGITIPDEATPVGHRLRMFKRQSGELGTVKDLKVQFVQAQGFIGNDKADTETDWENEWHVVEYPEPNGPDLWGLSLTPAEYRASGTMGFGFAIACTPAGLGAKGVVDAVGHFFTYTLPNGWIGSWVGRRSPDKIWWGS